MKCAKTWIKCQEIMRTFEGHFLLVVHETKEKKSRVRLVCSNVKNAVFENDLKPDVENLVFRDQSFKIFMQWKILILN